MLADDAFLLKPYLMKPYAFRKLDIAQRVFNYRLSRARRISENAFGLCAARFRILRKPIEVNPAKATKIVLAICSLHNFLMARKSIYATASDFDREINGRVIPGKWREECGDTGLTGLANQSSGRPSINATAVREEYKKYFVSVNGEVEWQYASCGYA